MGGGECKGSPVVPKQGESAETLLTRQVETPVLAGWCVTDAWAVVHPHDQDMKGPDGWTWGFPKDAGKGDTEPPPPPPRPLACPEPALRMTRWS